MKQFIKSLLGKKKCEVNESISPEETARKFSEIVEDTQRLIREVLDRNEERQEFIKKQLEIYHEQKEVCERVDKLEEKMSVREKGDKNTSYKQEYYHILHKCGHEDIDYLWISDEEDKLRQLDFIKNNVLCNLCFVEEANRKVDV